MAAEDSITEIESDPEIQLKQLIKGFLSKHDFLHEYRLQKLIYLAELFWLEDNESRLTDANFKPYMFGSYSEDISVMLEELQGEVRTTVDMRHGKLTTAYHGDNIDMPDDVAEIVEEVCSMAGDKSNEDLATWSKNTHLYQETNYGDLMNFQDYLERYKETEESDVSSEFGE